MTTKAKAMNTKIDWDYVNQATEIRRTYFVRLPDGRKMFKMYKPSEAAEIFKRNGWTGKIVSRVERSKQ